MEVYITRSNTERIIKKMDTKGLDITEFAKQMQSSNATEIIEKIKQTVNQK